MRRVFSHRVARYCCKRRHPLPLATAGRFPAAYCRYAQLREHVLRANMRKCTLVPSSSTPPWAKKAPPSARCQNGGSVHYNCAGCLPSGAMAKGPLRRACLWPASMLCGESHVFRVCESSPLSYCAPQVCAAFGCWLWSEEKEPLICHLDGRKFGMFTPPATAPADRPPP